MFVSRLSVNEFVLNSSLTVLGPVAGSIASHTREEECPANSQVMKGGTRDQTQVLRAAYDRLEKQAVQLGASGIIGIRTTYREIDQDIWEYTVLGTAVSGCASGADNRPFTCTFTGQEYYVLKMAGYRPVGVALGVCVYYQKFHQRVQQKIIGLGQNLERSDFTRGIYAARRNALILLEAEANALGASGVLGISITTKRTLNRQNGANQGMIIEFTALGTAVAAEKGDTLAIDYTMPLTG